MMLRRPDYNIGLFILGLSLTCVCTENDLTPAEQCEGQPVKDLRQRIHVEPCGKEVCNLVRGSNSTIIIKIKPETKVQTLVNEVHADIEGISLPFIGVTGTNACKDLIRADTGEKVTCPLAPNEEYIYKVVFPILAFYPQVSVRVRWSLNNGDKALICFELPAIIK